MRRQAMILSGVFCAMLVGAAAVLAQGPKPQSSPAYGPDNGFTYQGQLRSGGAPYNGTCAMQFSLWDSQSNLTGQQGLTLLLQPVTVTNGLFTTRPIFGQTYFDGSPRWLQVDVQCGSDGGFTTLSPRQRVSPSPYALYSLGNWGLNGNGGTNPANFIGTTDNLTLTLGVSSTTALRIVPASDIFGNASPNVIGGAGGNQATGGASGATIAGGGTASLGFNTVLSSSATIGGGSNNTAGAVAATVGGGAKNTAGGVGSVVAGGGVEGCGPGCFNVMGNSAAGDAATVGGGNGNSAAGYVATVGGGGRNSAGGRIATVSGGAGNDASGGYAMIPGGLLNTAQGGYSFAAGLKAKALHDGAFVWGDSTDADFASTGNDQYLIRARGGLGVNTNAPQAELDVHRMDGGYLVGKFKNEASSGDRSAVVDIENGDVSPSRWRLSVGGTGNGISLTGGQFYIEHYGTAGAALVIDTSKNFTLYPSSGSCTLSTGAVGWSCSSDRSLKENLVAVDSRAILERVGALPIAHWNPIGSDEGHIGPMAQDFYAAFNLGADDKHINTVDAQGVTLAAIQGLYQLVQEQQAEIAQLKAEASASGQSAHANSAAAQTDGILPLLVGLSLLMNVLLGAVVVAHLHKGGGA